MQALTVQCVWSAATDEMTNSPALTALPCYMPPRPPAIAPSAFYHLAPCPPLQTSNLSLPPLPAPAHFPRPPPACLPAAHPAASPEGGIHKVDVSLREALPPRERHPCNPLDLLPEVWRAVTYLLTHADFDVSPVKEPRRAVLRLLAVLAGMVAGVPVGLAFTSAVDTAVWQVGAVWTITLRRHKEH